MRLKLKGHMNILIFFGDMVRVNRLNIYNNDITDTPIDNVLRKLGGTFYDNCFTPAPDTPRSMACFFSGLLPKNNGCDTRTKWPGKFLSETNKSFLRVFQENGFSLNSYVHAGFSDLFFPRDVYDGMNQINDFQKFLEVVRENAQDSNNIFFVQNMDYHYCVDDLSASHKSETQGNKRVADSINRILESCEAESFDLIVIFSDHGCKLIGESQNWDSFLDEDRTKILMFIHRKGDRGINKVSHLTSIVDLYPYLFREYFQDFGINAASLVFDGKSLNCPDSERLLFVEDHYNYSKGKGFSTSFGSLTNIWGVVSERFRYTETLEGLVNIKYVEDKFNVNEIEYSKENIDVMNSKEFLATESSSYLSMRGQYDSLNQNEKDLNLTKNNSKSLYTNGDQRQNRSTRFFRVYYSIMQIIREKIN